MILGNNQCDDFANTEDCAFDKGIFLKLVYAILCFSIFIGDCCGKNDYRFCTFCLCEHNQREFVEEKVILGYLHNDTCPLGLIKSIGDGYCQDELNTEECRFDNGDCCKHHVLSNVCMECACANNETIIRNITTATCSEDLLSLLGDNLCHDEANTPQCEYDGKDCCGSIELTFCLECSCNDPRQQDLPRGIWTIFI